MFHTTIKLPDPYCDLELFELVEIVEETDTEVVFENRLYRPSQFAPGGKILVLRAGRKCVTKISMGLEPGPRVDGPGHLGRNQNEIEK
ncbi:hypothetical protein I5535_03185 [Rhodobacteraceae bacterium F11138]|nr:hypothetical protein [Rhodobacteraceae bacterium F11138]